MSKTVTIVLALAAGLAVGIAVGSRQTIAPADAQTATTTSFSAVPGAIGAQDISGPYEVQAGWPKDLATLPGHDKWTYGSARGIFAESPNRVFLLGGAELPAMRRPPVRLLTAIGPNVQFPVPGLPWRKPQRAGPAGHARIRQGMECGGATKPPYRELGVVRAGTTPSWSSTLERSSRTGRSGTTCSARTPSISARTMREASGWSTTTHASTNLPTTASAPADQDPNVPGADGAHSTTDVHGVAARLDLHRWL